MKDKIKYIGIALSVIAIVLLNSCRIFIVETIVKDKSAIKKKKVLVKDGKEIIYIPLVHLGSEKYYKEISDFLTKKRNEGYIVFYEGVKQSVGLDLEEDNLVDLKLRRLIGFHLTNLDEKENKSLPKYVNHSRSVHQTKEKLGLDTFKDINADLTRMELVNLYEGEYGEVLLDSCDFNTPLYEKYNCSKAQAYYKVVYTYREDALIEKILATEYNNIVVLFGKSHWIKIYPDLVHKHGFELVYGRI